MATNKENSNNPKLYDFDALINELKTKVTQELIRRETKITTQEIKIKVNNFLYKLLGGFNIISIILSLSIVFGLFGSAVFLLLKSYDVFHTFSLAADVRELSSVLLFISGIGSTGLGVASICNFMPIFEGVCSFFDIVIIRPFEKIINRSKDKSLYRIKKLGIDISYLNETLKSLSTMQDNFKYLIHSQYKDKLFTSKDVNLLYKHLTSSNISALIHLLYHNKIKDIKRLSVEEKEKLSLELAQKVAEVKNYAEQLQKTNNTNNNQPSNNQRHRRMERFHTYPHDDMLTEIFSDVETTNARKGRK